MFFKSIPIAAAWSALLALFLLALPSGAQRGSKPAAPTGLTATAGPAQISLAWNASAGASSYRLKRSRVSGKNYVTVPGAESLTATTFIDNDRTPGLRYYYVVSAVSSSEVESSNSKQASAVPLDLPAAPFDPAIAFLDVRDPYGNDNRLTVINADGSNRTQLTSYPVGPPAFSPDGQRIAFIAGASAPLGSGLYTIGRDGADLVKVCPVASATPSSKVDWARLPDGQERIAFLDTVAGSADSNFAAYLTSGVAAGASVVRLTPGDAPNVFSLSFSGDGARLYCCELNGGVEALVSFRFDTASGAPDRSVVSLPSSLAGCLLLDVAAARTQNKIALRVMFPVDTVNPQNGTHIVDLDRGTTQRLTTTEFITGPCWSPDDSRIAFSLEIDGLSTIGAIALSGGQPDNLSYNPSSVRWHESPAWRRF